MNMLWQGKPIGIVNHGLEIAMPESPHTYDVPRRSDSWSHRLVWICATLLSLISSKYLLVDANWRKPTSL